MKQQYRVRCQEPDVSPGSVNGVAAPDWWDVFPMEFEFFCSGDQEAGDYVMHQQHKYEAAFLEAAGGKPTFWDSRPYYASSLYLVKHDPVGNERVSPVFVGSGQKQLSSA